MRDAVDVCPALPEPVTPEGLSPHLEEIALAGVSGHPHSAVFRWRHAEETYSMFGTMWETIGVPMPADGADIARIIVAISQPEDLTATAALLDEHLKRTTDTHLSFWHRFVGAGGEVHRVHVIGYTERDQEGVAVESVFFLNDTTAHVINKRAAITLVEATHATLNATTGQGLVKELLMIFRDSGECRFAGFFCDRRELVLCEVSGSDKWLLPDAHKAAQMSLAAERAVIFPDCEESEQGRATAIASPLITLGAAFVLWSDELPLFTGPYLPVYERLLQAVESVLQAVPW